MKSRKKDERLNGLFSEYLQEGEEPPASVTTGAKELMRKRAAALSVAETENGGGTLGRTGFFGRDKTLYVVAAVALFLVLLSACLFLIGRGSGDDFLVGLSQVESLQLSERVKDYEEKDFLPFVNAASVTEYKEYSLNDDIDRYGKGNVLVYYTEFVTADGIVVTVYTEVEGIYLDNLSAYKQKKSAQKIGEICFYRQSDSDGEAYYFTYSSYGYNLQIGSTERGVVNGILGYIAQSFQNAG